MRGEGFDRSRRWRVPEVVQTSSMDCGPAALKALCDGFGVAVSYSGLRELCQTDVDGTSMNSLEEVADHLGFCAEQTMLPRDHILVGTARVLPAIVVLVHGGVKHFVVVWRRVGPFVMVMDPEVGRRWVRARRLLSQLYMHAQEIDALEWREWAGSEQNQVITRARLAALGLGKAAQGILL